MSNRHYWPEPPKKNPVVHFVEHESGVICRGTLFSNGTWNVGVFIGDTVERMERNGYLGVRTPFSEEAERAAFEAAYKEMCPSLRQPIWIEGMYDKSYHQTAFKLWLAAVRHEKGL